MVETKNASHSNQSSCYKNQSFSDDCLQIEARALFSRPPDEKFRWTEEQQEMFINIAKHDHQKFEI